MDNKEILRIPKYPTYAVKAINNSMGDGDIYFTFAFLYKNQMYSHDTGKALIEYVGDEVLEKWELNIVYKSSGARDNLIKE